MPFSVKGKTALVTGGGSGIGYEFAKLLLQNGANVLVADLTLRSEAEAFLSTYQSTPRAIFQRTDVTKWKELDNMFSVAVREFGSVDIVCPSAGVFEPSFSNFWIPPGTMPSIDDPSGGSYKTIDINLIHPIRLTQLAISHFLSSSPPSSASNPKSIVHICSVASQGAGLISPLYIATKHGLDGFVRSLGDLEASHGIRVAAVEPGAVKTPLFTDHPEKMRMMNDSSQEWVCPQEVARVMLALVQENAVHNTAIFDQGRVFDESTAKVNIHGGSVLEVLVGNVRDVPLFGNQGPMSSGALGWKSSSPETTYAEILQSLKPGWGIH